MFKLNLIYRDKIDNLRKNDKLRAQQNSKNAL